jgi:4-amino-4-deoxy-L-arabinose transferase-like glycosyltransferase
MTTSTRFYALERWLIVALTLLAFGLRVWRLADVPPGWRDDEVINLLVISQHVLDGDWAFYFPDASGNEALYHTLNAGMLALFSANEWSFRFLSALLGTITVPLTYLVGRRLFGPAVGLLAAALLAVSFWSLMYSRFGLRQVMSPPLMLLAFYFFWRGLQGREWRGWLVGQSSILNYLLTAVFIALGFYTYFASRGVPLILLAFMGYLALFAWRLFRRHWPGFVILFAAMALLTVPLILTLQQQPEAEARVSELARPLIEARAGDFGLVAEYTLTTLNMFHSDGDAEWLYNIPHRPVFGWLGAILFWMGVAMAAWYAFAPLFSRLRAFWRRSQRPSPATDYQPPTTSHLSLAAAFLGLWWLAGISPGFISVPPASLGHTILAQPATFILAALPVGWLMGRPLSRKPLAVSYKLYSEDETQLKANRLQLKAYSLQLIAILLALVLLVGMGWRDAQDYFVNWPSRGMVRFLYRADIQAAARYLNAHPEVTDVGLSSVLAGPWDQLALAIDLQTAVHPRWYNSDRAVLLQPNLVLAGSPQPPQFLVEAYTQLADKPGLGAYQFYETAYDVPPGEEICFVNGLCVVTAVYDPIAQTLTLFWRASDALNLPDVPLISNPPPPGVYAGPRLSVFAHLLDADGNLLTGDDGLWVDAWSLQPGDQFAQIHHLPAPAGATPATVAFGLYDPMTGERILTMDGRERLEIGDKR